MSLSRKLKPDRTIGGAIIPLSMILIFGLVTLIFGVQRGMCSVAIMMGIFFLFYLYAYIRTGNRYNLAVCAESLFLIYMLVVAVTDRIADSFNRLEYALAYFAGMTFFAFLIIYIALTRKLKWRGREIFELAGEAVDQSGNGYTSRPLPVGKLEYSPQQMQGFSRFCARNLVALPYITSKNTTLVPVKMGDEFGRLLGLSGDYRDATWVNFDVDGEVSVHIAQKDYLEYREALAFDQLCSSMGQVFIDFFDLYKKGEGVRIIDRMDDLKLGFLS